jgi:hypothetical protein
MESLDPINNSNILGQNLQCNIGTYERIVTGDISIGMDTN